MINNILQAVIIFCGLSITFFLLFNARRDDKENEVYYYLTGDKVPEQYQKLIACIRDMILNLCILLAVIALLLILIFIYYMFT